MKLHVPAWNYGTLRVADEGEEHIYKSDDCMDPYLYLMWDRHDAAVDAKIDFSDFHEEDLIWNDKIKEVSRLFRNFFPIDRSEQSESDIDYDRFFYDIADVEILIAEALRAGIEKYLEKTDFEILDGKLYRKGFDWNNYVGKSSPEDW